MPVAPAPSSCALWCRFNLPPAVIGHLGGSFGTPQMNHLVMVHFGGGGKTKLPEFFQSPMRPRSSAIGARNEAPKALRGVGCGEGVSPSPWGERSGDGAVPPPQKMFRFLSSKRRVLVHLWCYFLQLINLNLHIQIAKTFI